MPTLGHTQCEARCHTMMMHTNDVTTLLVNHSTCLLTSVKTRQSPLDPLHDMRLPYTHG